MRRAMAAAVIGLLVAGCAGLLSLGDVEYATAADGGATDAPPDDADARADGDGGPTYFDAADPGRWTTFGVDNIVGAATSQQWGNAVFDGRYVHFAPSAVNTPVLAYDTKAAGFAKAASWRVLPIPVPDSGVPYLQGPLAYVGGTVFLLPGSGASDPDLLLWRAPGAPADAGWQSLDVAPIDAGTWFTYPGFDDRYLYFTPFRQRGTSNPSGRVVRIDPAALPTGAPAMFDLVGNLSPQAQGFNDAVFDGRYLYLTPNTNPSGPSGVFARYDTHGPFDDAGVWDWFNLASMSSALTSFGCGTFDGRYIYFFSNHGAERPHAIVARYDTRAPFLDKASWIYADLVDPEAGAGRIVDFFAGAAFDGRYVYALANDSVTDTSSFLLRIDTTVGFSGQALQPVPLPDVLQLTNPHQLAWAGLAFDGQYLYLTPFVGGIMARFEARTPAPPPPPSSVF
jgi:hypothetical protein